LAEPRPLISERHLRRILKDYFSHYHRWRCHDLDLGRELVRVHGKGRKVREVPVKNGTLDALRAWLHCRGDEPGPLGLPGSQGRAC